ncbi:cobalt-precorrin-6A reductase [Tessaracoccus palaemonis]|uniref:Cobalt-precorrin-6A reductase n=1 Tax=Tessaracoccus palaemonis TaxID=2829499 RepID=A0ABX8SKT7_9ACTN|nr:cobalt-precorrin-6A reductase [Tessaracoccus palaemonis]QXT63982.1 cobalt-precorrin-6A reductase [Tessaracoccus palaemonis]
MILILGGTVEGRLLADALAGLGAPHLLSLAGRTASAPAAGPVRVGGFGGVDGLTDFLRGNDVTVVVDATHPFAATMSRNAADACRAAGVPLIRVERPGWASHEGAAAWTWVDDHPAAAAAVLGLGARRPLLTVGRLHTLDYSPALDALPVLARVTEPPDDDLPAAWRLLVSRGPFTPAGEALLFAREGIDCLVTKDSGGGSTAPKLDAAREAGAAVVIVRRAPGPAGVRTVGSVEECLQLLERFTSA